MARVCEHKQHNVQRTPFALSTGKTQYVDMVTGWNPVTRQVEFCDEGFMSIQPKKKTKKKFEDDEE